MKLGLVATELEVRRTLLSRRERPSLVDNNPLPSPHETHDSIPEPLLVPIGSAAVAEYDFGIASRSGGFDSVLHDIAESVDQSWQMGE